MRVFLGFDPRQPVAFQVLAHSIWTRASKPVSITPLILRQLPITRRGLTDFTYSRFLVPWLCDYEGMAVFIDSDFICLGDVCELESLVLESRPMLPVHVVKNKIRFEWASLMAFDCQFCKGLTPEFVQDKKNSLFDMAWAADVGELPSEWNHLVEYDPPRKDAKLIHYTQGIPCWPETKDCEYADEWRREAKACMSSVSFEALMGNSVHKKAVMDRLAKAG